MRKIIVERREGRKVVKGLLIQRGKGKVQAVVASATAAKAQVASIAQAAVSVEIVGDEVDTTKRPRRIIHDTRLAHHRI